MTIRTRSQVDGERIYHQVQAPAASRQAREYDALCQRLPLLLLRQGLAQTVSWLFAKRFNEKEERTNHGELLDQIREILLPGGSQVEFVEAVLSADMGRYRELTRRALELSEWYRRFSRAARDQPDKQESSGSSEAA